MLDFDAALLRMMTTMAATIHIQLLGEFRLVYNGTLVSGVNTPRLQALLAYLLLHRAAPQPRQRLAFIFWPDSTEAQARTNLRNLLHQLRGAQPGAESLIDLDRQTVHWNTALPFMLDVAEFERILAVAEHTTDSAAAREALDTALRLYQGELLPGCYDDWLLAERERLERAFVAALKQCIGLCERQRDYRAAISHAQVLLRHDPIQESTYRHLMHLYAMDGDRAAALRVYHSCATTLQRELGVEPSQATSEAYERLLNLETQVPAPTSLRARLPLVGRDEEWAALQRAWRSAASGCASIALVTGEVGIGKTRLVEELLEWADRQGFTAASARCYAADGHLPYAPVRDWLRAEVFQKAVRSLDPIWLAELTRLLPELLADQPAFGTAGPLTSMWQRQRLFESLARAVLAGSQPLVLLIDDIHWCDLDTLAWLHYLLRFDPRARMLVVGTLRPEEIADDHPLAELRWQLRYSGALSEIELTRLDRAQTIALATHAASRALPSALAAQLYDETEGNPLFIVEMVRAGLEARAKDPANPEPLPPRVQAVIEAHLGRLSPDARRLAQVAAAIGRAFRLDVLAHASAMDEEALVRGIDELWQQRIVREQGGDTYDFSHDKLRDVVSANLSRARQRFLHRRVAEALVLVHADALDRASSQIAAQYERGGVTDQAIRYYQRAATIAQHLSSAEVIAYASRALGLLQALPETAERDQVELDLQLLLGANIASIRGQGAPEAVQAYARARQLCLQKGDVVQRLQALWGLWSFHLIRVEYTTARELAEQLVQISTVAGDPALCLVSYTSLGATLMWVGELTSARTYLEQARMHYDSRWQQAMAPSDWIDHRVICLICTSWTLWFLGYPDQALQRSQEAIALAEQNAHPPSQTFALNMAAHLHHYRHEPQLILAYAERAQAVAGAQGFQMMLASATMLRHRALVDMRPEPGLAAQLRQGLDAWRATGAELQRTHFLAMLAEAYAQLGQPADGLPLLAEALAMAEQSGERFYEAELHRLMGELLLQHGAPTSEAETYFHQAIATAHRQSARSLELRATMSLARLWQHQGQAGAARALLVDCVGWFTEGFATPDLVAARTLLDRLSAD